MKGACSSTLNGGAIVDSGCLPSSPSPPAPKRRREDKGFIPSIPDPHTIPTSSSSLGPRPLAQASLVPAWQEEGRPADWAQCRWVNEDGTTCTKDGSVYVVWAHMRDQHGIKGHVSEGPAKILTCRWPGCNKQGSSEELDKQCTDAHVKELKARFPAVKKVACLYHGCGVTMGRDSMRRHLATKHYEAKWACEICGSKKRLSDSMNRFLHFSWCLEELMKRDSRFRTRRTL